MPSNVLVLTTTLYRSLDELRFDLACRMVGAAVGHGYRVVIVDNSKDILVGKRLRNIGANVFSASVDGMAPGRRQLFSLAEKVYPSDFLLWLEPEKDDLVRFISEITAPLKTGESDIVVVGRTDKSWQTYPESQVESEQRALKIFREVTGLDLDPMMGPVAFTPKALRFFAQCDPSKYGSITGYIQHVAPLEAHAKGLKVTGVKVDFCYPLAQRAEEEGALIEKIRQKRQQQFIECTDAYRKTAAALGLLKI